MIMAKEKVLRETSLPNRKVTQLSERALRMKKQQDTMLTNEQIWQFEKEFKGVADAYQADFNK